MSGSRPQAWLSWSTGKDSAMALHAVRAAGEVEVTGLLCTVNGSFDRVSMHGVRRDLLNAQAKALGLPLHVVELPWPCPNGVYERQLAAALESAVGVRHVIFGDLFLEDVRAYREGQLTGTGIEPVFPLWGRPTAALAQEMLALGVHAVISCVDPAQAPVELAGRRFDAELLAGLPDSVDPCGERGEFHTFVTDAPGFAHPVAVQTGAVIERDHLVFADLYPVGQDSPTDVPFNDRPGGGARSARTRRVPRSP